MAQTGNPCIPEGRFKVISHIVHLRPVLLHETLSSTKQGQQGRMAQLIKAAKPNDLNFISRTHSCKLSFDLPMHVHAHPQNAIYRNKTKNKTHHTHTFQQRPGLLRRRGSSEVEKDQVCKSHQLACL